MPNSPTTPPFTIRSMSLSDMHYALDWAAAEGWNPGLNDETPFYNADPKGFLLGVVEGEPVGCISAVRYSETFGFIGFYIVKPQWRGRGYGLQLWQAGLDYLGDRTVGLDGVVAQIDNYRTYGFQVAYRHLRHETQGQAYPANSAHQVLQDVSFEQLHAYDRQHFPVPRSTFLQEWVNTYPGYAAFENGDMVGYGVIRETRNGYKVGPLFANTATIADQLWRSLSSHAVDAPIFLDTPDANPSVNELIQTYSMAPVFECARMYTNTAPSLPIDHIFGVTTLELG